MRGINIRSLLRPAALAALAGATLTASPTAAQQVPIRSEDLSSIYPRSIGPAVTGGRQHDVEADPSNPSLVYVASASGGLWRSLNRGHTWTNLTDHLPVSTFGDVALAPSNPRIVYAGTGEQNNRQSTSWGNGVYRSDDGGDSWNHIGLEDTRHIGEVQVHPTNPDIVFVAAVGNLWAPSDDRGVYRTTDGGRSWEKVLFIDEFTGAIDLRLDPLNPMNVYAATYQRQRRAWGFNGGGPGSGIWKSADGGDTWTELTNGLPSEDMGRIGIAISESNPQVLMAIVETANSETTGIYRTESGGASWTRVNELNIRPMYYSHIFIDPSNDQRVYALATSSFKSENGGQTFEPIADRPVYDVGVHADHHTMWIDPNNPDHFFMAGDAGLHETYDRGVNFQKRNNFVTSQFYGIGVDMRNPYRVYGGLQDNHSFAGPNENRRWVGIVNDDWQQTGFGDGMFWQPNPFDTTQAYGTSNGGTYFRLDTRTGDMLDIEPAQNPDHEPYRFDWTSPVLASQHDPDMVMLAGNRVFISRDRGNSWSIVSEDLSRQIDRDTLSIMGVQGGEIPISRNDGTSSYGEAVTVSESPVDPNVLWVGFDDGNLQVSRDGGRSWTEVSRNVRGLADGTYVSRIAASRRSPGTAWAAFDAHRDGDFAPYLYITEDFGQSWTPMHADLPTGSVLSFVEHPDNPDVVFAGTEHALHVSTDAGYSWAKVPNLPTTAYDDIVIHPRDKDLVLGTHGRGIWILDDTRPIAEWTQVAVEDPIHLFSIPSREIFVYWKDTSYRGDAEFAGSNPPDGVEVTYRIGGGTGPAYLRVENAAGQLVRRLQVPSTPGTHRVNWDLNWGFAEDEVWERWEDDRVSRDVGDGGSHWVSPGSYRITLEARGSERTQSMEVLPDPVTRLTQGEYEAREAFLNDVQSLIEDIQARMGGASAQSRAQLQGWMRELGGIGSSMRGGSVRPGTIYPPTQTMRDQVARVRSALAGM